MAADLFLLCRFICHDFLQGCCQPCDALYLGRNDDLRCLAVSNFCKSLQALQSKNRFICSCFLDHTKSLCSCLLYFKDCLCLSI